jgi:hypothetical protein
MKLMQFILEVHSLTHEYFLGLACCFNPPWKLGGGQHLKSILPVTKECLLLLETSSQVGQSAAAIKDCFIT